MFLSRSAFGVIVVGSHFSQLDRVGRPFPGWEQFYLHLDGWLRQHLLGGWRRLAPLPRDELVPLTRAFLDDRFVISSKLGYGRCLVAWHTGMAGLSLVDALLETDLGLTLVSMPGGPSELEGLRLRAMWMLERGAVCSSSVKDQGHSFSVGMHPWRQLASVWRVRLISLHLSL